MQEKLIEVFDEVIAMQCHCCTNESDYKIVFKKKAGTGYINKSVSLCKSCFEQLQDEVMATSTEDDEDDGECDCDNES